MNAARIAEHREAYELPMSDEPSMRLSFDLIVDAPQGVARLRDLILSLAVLGKLVSQHEDDRPAVDLVQRLLVEKARLIESGKIRPSRGESDELPEVDYQLPRGWVAARLSDLAWPQAGFAFKSSGFNEVGAGLPLIRIRDVGVSNPTTFFAGEYRDEFVVRRGDWLISMDGDFRVAPWQGPTSLLNQRVTRLIFFDASVPPLYICLALQQQLRKLQGTKAYTTVDHLSGAQIASCVIPLPPLAEQARIVARVEELMQLCDSLEAHGRLQDEQHARLVATLFDALAASESAHALADNWQRIAAHFDLLLDRTEAVDALEQTILQLAVRGLLVPQDPTNEPASQLLDRIRAENDRLIEAGVLKRSKALPDVTADEQAFESPNGWHWVRIDDYCEVQGGIQKTPLRRPVQHHFPYLRVANVQRNVLNLGTLERYELSDEEVERWRLRSGDLLIVEGNGSEKEIGRCAIWRGEVDPCVFQNHLIRVRPLLVAEAVEFLQLFLNSPDGAAEMKRLAITTSGLYNLSVGKIRNLGVPVPPLAEQHRIIARVEQLRRLCANLRERLQQARNMQGHLADALVSAAVQSPAC